MTNETNRFTRHPKCERCGFPYGFHICLDLDEPVMKKTVSTVKPRKTRNISEELREKLAEGARQKGRNFREKNQKTFEKMAYDYEENWFTLQQLAVKYNFSKQLVRDVLEDMGIEIRQRGATRESYILKNNLEEIIKDYESGMPRREVAQKWKVAQGSLSRAFKQAGVKMRPRHFKTPKYTFN